MQLQIECNKMPLQQQSCWLCKQPIEGTEARVIVCDDQGKTYGDVCTQCLNQGFNWLSDRFDQLNRPMKLIPIRRAEQLKTPIGA